jgi:hypothetical protein
MQMLDYLVGMNDLELFVSEREGLVQIAGPRQDSLPQGRLPPLVHNLDAVEPHRPDSCAQLQSPLTVVTAAVQERDIAL